MKTVKEVSDISGVSVRTLHHYDAIGLLKPTTVTASGYRLYDDAALARLQSILLFRELEFPLKDIKTMLDAPQFDMQAALETQITLLTMQRERLDKLLAFARTLQQNGGNHMNFQAFDKSKLEAYAEEAKAKWGGTPAYQEYEQKSAGKSAETMQAYGEGLMEIFAEFGKIKDTDPSGDTAQALVRKLQAYITEHFYTCTDEILAGLGQMYAAEGEMKHNVDEKGGAGTADFAANAIKKMVSPMD